MLKMLDGSFKIFCIWWKLLQLKHMYNKQKGVFPFFMFLTHVQCTFLHSLSYVKIFYYDMTVLLGWSFWLDCQAVTLSGRHWTWMNVSVCVHGKGLYHYYRDVWNPYSENHFTTWHHCHSHDSHLKTHFFCSTLYSHWIKFPPVGSSPLTVATSTLFVAVLPGFHFLLCTLLVLPTGHLTIFCWSLLSFKEVYWCTLLCLSNRVNCIL